MSIESDTKAIIERFAAIKAIPVGKVLRNLARDFAQAGFNEIPEAQKSKSEFWYYRDKEGRRHYLHQSQLRKEVTGAAFTVTGKPRKTTLRRFISQSRKLHKVRIAKGWSQGVWIVLERLLGMTPKKQPRKGLPDVIQQYAEAEFSGMDSPTPEVVISAYLRFTARIEVPGSVMEAGWALARERFRKEYTRVVRKAWRNGR